VKDLSERDAINLLFLSGLSTSETVNETSGRGVGMDAVKSAVEAMKGSIEVESVSGKGTMFRLRLPLTLAVIKALLFEVGGRLYAIPLSAVSELTRIMKDDLITVNGKDTLLLRDEVISIVHLEELFMINEHKTQKKFVIILGIGGRGIGLLSDRLIGQQDLVIKAVDDHYARSGIVTGASILGDGRVVLILDGPALLKKAIEDEKKKAVKVRR
jgi:two-component system chemotaxis sensor kinase CheA